MDPEIYFVRSKEKVEVDFLIKLPNDRYVAAEVKTTGADMTSQQIKLTESLGVNIVENWALSPMKTLGFAHAKSISFEEINENLERLAFFKQIGTK